MLWECDNCSAHYTTTDGTKEVQIGGCPDCGGNVRPYREQPSPTQSNGTLRNMVDSDTQTDAGGNPLKEGTIMGDDGERPPWKRDNYMHSHILPSDFHGWTDRDFEVYSNNLAKRHMAGEHDQEEHPDCAICQEEFPHESPYYKDILSAFVEGTFDSVVYELEQYRDGVNGYGQGDKESADEENEAGEFRIGDQWFDGADGDPLPSPLAALAATPPDWGFDMFDVKGPHGPIWFGDQPNEVPMQGDDRRWVNVCPNCDGHGCPACGHEGVIHSLNNPQVHGEGHQEPHDAYINDLIWDKRNKPMQEGLTTDFENFGPRRVGAFPESEYQHPEPGNGRDFTLTDLIGDQRDKTVPTAYDDEFSTLCPRCKGNGCPHCKGLGEIFERWTPEAPLRADEGYATPAVIDPRQIGNGDWGELTPIRQGALDKNDAPERKILGMSTHDRETLNMEPYLPWTHEGTSKEGGPEMLAPVVAPLAEEAIGGEMGGAGLMGGGGSGLSALGPHNVAGGLMKNVFGNGVEVQSHVTADYETPSTLPKIPDHGGNDPEKVDPHEFNDQDKNPSNFYNPNLEDSGALGEDEVRQHAGFRPDSPGVERLNVMMPIVQHYFFSPESGEKDPMIMALHNLLESENPGYLDKVTPEEERAAREFMHSKGEKPRDVHAKTAIINVDPNAQNQMVQNIVRQGERPTSETPPGGYTQTGHCPNCGGVMDPNGNCPQCGQMGGQGQIPQGMGGMPATFSHTDLLAALIYEGANHQGPITPEQIAAVQQLLIEEGRAEETPAVPLKPQDYAHELAKIQQVNEVAPQVNPTEATPPPPPPPQGQPGGMPVPGMAPGEAGGQPMSPMAAVVQGADNVAKRCPSCGSATTGILSPGYAWCHSCQKPYEMPNMIADGDDAASGVTSKVADSLQEPQQVQNPVDAPAAERPHPRDIEAEEDSSLSWKDSEGNPLIAGQEYEMVHPTIPIPDMVRVDRIKPDGLELSIIGTFENSGMGPIHLSKREVDMQKLSFNPVAENADDRGEPPPGQQTPGNQQSPTQTTDEYDNSNHLPAVSNVLAAVAEIEPDCCPRCGSKSITSSMSSPETVLNECHNIKCENVWEEKDDFPAFGINASARDWLNESADDDFFENVERAQAMREADAGVSTRDIRAVAAKDTRLQAIKEKLNDAHNEKVAGRKFTPKEQKEFIDEEGTARNADLLDLTGTHYTTRYDYTGKANGENVPSEHLVLGL